MSQDLLRELCNLVMIFSDRSEDRALKSQTQELVRRAWAWIQASDEGQTVQDEAYTEAMEEIKKLELQVSRLKRELSAKVERIAELEDLIRRSIIFGDTK